MYKIVEKKVLNPTVILMKIDAPLVAKKAEPGQFIILRVDDEGERIPLTVADYDRENGTVTIIFQKVGASTEKLAHLNEGEYICDFVGPLGLIPFPLKSISFLVIFKSDFGAALLVSTKRSLLYINSNCT